MATSPLFGWEEPDDTDLVKDGAAAIRTLGNAIDTSMGDLLGGTTGQVLSKNSNTNMDFTWVTSDDANAIQNAIVDAKGDLIAATANDTPARLAVGSNYGFLQADSAQATGLVWNNASWIAFTPTISSTSGTITTVSGSGTYQRIGKTCFVRFLINITTNGTGGTDIRVADLPFTAINGSDQVGVFRENNVTGKLGSVQAAGNTTQAFMRYYDNTYPGANGTQFFGSLVYEVA